MGRRVSHWVVQHYELVQDYFLSVYLRLGLAIVLELIVGLGIVVGVSKTAEYCP